MATPSCLRLRGSRLSALAFLVACSGSEGSRLDVEVEYPTAAPLDRLGSLHVWVLRTRDAPSLEDRVVPAGCNGLVGGAFDPYDRDFDRLADRVFLLPADGAPSLEEVPRGSALVYVEAVDVSGQSLLAGCSDLDMSGAAVTVAVALRAARTFECGDPQVNGLSCDDGQLCTVGETCSGGSCQGGAPRDCSFVIEPCTGASCDPQLGCVAQPLPNNTSCSDGLFCTVGEVCMNGECLGAPRDCSAFENECSVATCQEGQNACVTTVFPDTTGCDDGLFCTVNGQCFSGQCFSDPRDCEAEVEVDQCNEAACNEDSDECVRVPLVGDPCEHDDPCVTEATCDAAGDCVGEPDPECDD